MSHLKKDRLLSWDVLLRVWCFASKKGERLAREYIRRCHQLDTLSVFKRFFCRWHEGSTQGEMLDDTAAVIIY